MMERKCRQFAPPQPSDDIDLPLFDLALSERQGEGVREGEAEKPGSSHGHTDNKGDSTDSHSQKCNGMEAPPDRLLPPRAAVTIQTDTSGIDASAHLAASLSQSASHASEDPALREYESLLAGRSVFTRSPRAMNATGGFLSALACTTAAIAVPPATVPVNPALPHSTAGLAAPVAAPPAAATQPSAAVTPASVDDDSFHTSIPFSSFVQTVRSPAFREQIQYEVELLNSLPSAAMNPSEQSDIFTPAVIDPVMAAKNRYCNVIPTTFGRIALTAPSSTCPPSASSVAATYINASLLPPLLPGCVYPALATQAPLPSTMSDHWQLIWEQRVSIILMLTRTEEKGMTKAHVYWPEGETDSEGNLPTVQHGPFSITLLHVHREQDIVIREMIVSRDDEQVEGRASSDTPTMRHVKQLQFTGWPDFGTPDERSSDAFMKMFSLYRQMRSEVQQQEEERRKEEEKKKSVSVTAASATAVSAAFSSTAATSVSSSPSPSSPSSSSLPTPSFYPPALVHCSAGLGRSGVWIAIDQILDHLAAVSCAHSHSHASTSTNSGEPRHPHQQRSQEGSASNNSNDSVRIDVFSLVRSMRQYRAAMVQSRDQYAYIFQFIAKCIQKKVFGINMA